MQQHPSVIAQVEPGVGGVSAALTLPCEGRNVSDRSSAQAKHIEKQVKQIFKESLVPFSC